MRETLYETARSDAPNKMNLETDIFCFEYGNLKYKPRRKPTAEVHSRIRWEQRS